MHTETVVGKPIDSLKVEVRKEEGNVENKLMSIGQYAREMRAFLPKDLLRPAKSRLFAFSGLLLTAFVAAFMMVNFDLGVFSKLVLGGLIGYAFGGTAFLAHEILHGSVVRNRKLQHVLGFLGFTPFLISPTFWCFWHNRLHHGHTQKLIKDPDAFPTKRVYKQSNYMQKMYKFTPGSGYARSYAYFFFWFFFHNLVNQTYLRFRNKIFADLDHTKASLELLLQLSIMGTYVYFIGSNFVYGVVIPFAIMNYMLMSYISTNHNISPLTKTNDPLVNSLSVTNHPILEAMHFNFGYHVEHHLFPTMSPKRAKEVNKLLKEKYPEKFKQMPKSTAMGILYKTPRIYKNANELIHPYTGETHKTI